MQRVALVHHGGVHHLRLGSARSPCPGFCARMMLAREARRVHLDVPVREGAADDPVVVFRIPLRRHHGLASAGRASLEVRVLRRSIVERLDQLLRCDRRVVHGAIGEVDDLLGMAEREHAVGTVGRGVAGIGGRGRVAEAQRHLHVAVALDRSGKPAVAHHHELAVPVLGRHPELGVDVGVGRRLEHQRHAAVPRDRLCGRRGSASLRSAAATAGLNEWSGLDQVRADDRGLGNRDSPQTLARRRGGRGGEKHETQASEHVILLQCTFDRKDPTTIAPSM